MSSYGHVHFVDNAASNVQVVWRTGRPPSSWPISPRPRPARCPLANHLRRCSTNSPTVNPASLMIASIRLRLSSLTCRGTGTGLGSPSLHITVWRRPSRTTRKPALSKVLTMSRGESAGSRSVISSHTNRRPACVLSRDSVRGARQRTQNLLAQCQNPRALGIRGSQELLIQFGRITSQRRPDAHLVAGLQRSRHPGQEADVLPVHVDVHEPP